MECTVTIFSKIGICEITKSIKTTTEDLIEDPFDEGELWGYENISVSVAEDLEQAAKNIREYCKIKAKAPEGA